MSTPKKPDWLSDHAVLEFQRKLDAYYPAIEAAVKDLQRLAPMIEIAQAAARAIPPGFEESIRRAAEFSRLYADQYQRIIEGLALQRKFLPTLAAHGWLISPLAPADELERLHALYTKGGIDAVDADLGGYDDEDCKAIVDDIIKARPSFSAWALTFQKALRAMERGDHELAIPIWLMAIDGVCAKEFGHGVFDGLGKMRKDQLREQLSPEASVVYDVIALAWIQVIEGFTVGRRHRSRVVLNRQAVMHGSRPGIGTRLDAIQCLLALQVLAQLLTAKVKDPERRRKTQEPA